MRMRSLLTLLLPLAVLLGVPALWAAAWPSASGENWPSGPQNTSVSSHTVMGSGGPMEGMWEKVLEGDNSLVTYFEDFNHRFTDGTVAVHPEFLASGFSCFPVGPQLQEIIRMGTALGISSLLVMSAGTVASTGINCNHDGQVMLNPSAVTTGAATLNLPNFNFAAVGGAGGSAAYANVTFRFATRLSLLNSDLVTQWNSGAAIGFAKDDDNNLMVAATGALSNAEWNPGADGGIVFHISQSDALTINVKRGVTVTSQSVALTGLTDVGECLYLGFVYNASTTIGTGTLQAYYKFGASCGDIISNETGEALKPWLPLGSAITGAVFPTTSQMYPLTWEFVNHATSPGDGGMLTEWVAGAVRKEGMHGY